MIRELKLTGSPRNESPPKDSSLSVVNERYGTPVGRRFTVDLSPHSSPDVSFPSSYRLTVVKDVVQTVVP